MSELDTRLIERLKQAAWDSVLGQHALAQQTLYAQAAARLTALSTENAELRGALKVRAKQLGVACMTHDLTHALACGLCAREADRLLRELCAVARLEDQTHHLADYTIAQTIEFDARENAAWAAAFAYTDNRQAIAADSPNDRR